MEKNNSPDPQPGDKPKRGGIFGFFKPKGRKICTLTRAETDAMIDAMKHHRYNSWKAAIMERYNLQRSDFRVDEKTCDLYYPK